MEGRRGEVQKGLHLMTSSSVVFWLSCSKSWDYSSFVALIHHRNEGIKVTGR